MTAADRTRIKAALDTEQRARREARIRSLNLETCNGCGAEPGTYLQGCRACWDRKRRAKR